MEHTGDITFVVWLFFAGIVFLAGLVHGTLGLGFPLMATPLLALFVDVRSAILITLLPTAAVNVASILRGGRWGESIGQFWPLGVYALAGGFLGSTVIVVSDPSPFKLALAALILLYLATGWLGNFRMHWVSAHRGWSMLAFGLAAGVSAGSTNVMVPILIIYALEVGLGTTATVQVFNMCFLAGKLSQMIVFAASALLTGPVLLSTAPLAVIALGALFIGMALRSRFGAEGYRSAIKGVLFVVALVLVAQYAVQAAE